MDKGVLEAARAVRPYLTQLVGPAAAGELDSRIADLLRAAERGDDVGEELRALLDGEMAVSSFLAEVLADAPTYRPPQVQPGYQPGHMREATMEPLAGDTDPVVHAGKYVCPRGDYVWYRPAVGTPPPACPTHRVGLVRT